MWWPCSQIMQDEYGTMPWYENLLIYRVMRLLIQCEISIESHTQSFNVIREGNLGASDSRCRN